MKKKSSKGLHHLSLIFSPAVTGSCQDSSQHNRNPLAHPPTYTHLPSKTHVCIHIDMQQCIKCTITCKEWTTHTDKAVHQQVLQTGVEQRVQHVFFISPTLVISVCVHVCGCSTQSNSVWSMIYYCTDTFPVPSIFFFFLTGYPTQCCRVVEDYNSWHRVDKVHTGQVIASSLDYIGRHSTSYPNLKNNNNKKNLTDSYFLLWKDFIWLTGATENLLLIANKLEL